MPLVSIVVPTHDRRESLGRLLAALARQTAWAVPFEVVVVVDGSTDGTCELLAHYQPPYALIWHHQEQRGRAAACNAGLARARGSLVIYLDDDMTPSEGFVTAHAKSHPAGSRNAVMGAAPIVLGPADTSVARYVAQKFNRHLERLAAPNHRFVLRDFYSGNLSVRRDVLLEVGGFDEDFRAYGHEDLELAWRLRSVGAEFTFNADALAHQHYDKDLYALAHDNVAKGRTAVLLAGKHPSAAPELRLADVGAGSALRRFVIRALVAATDIAPVTLPAIAHAATLFGRMRSGVDERVYALVLDYCFLLGVRAARSEAVRGTVIA
jgi:glycosyltransferase involved in cell wall biosynthesis